MNKYIEKNIDDITKENNIPREIFVDYLLEMGLLSYRKEIIFSEIADIVREADEKN